MFFTAVLYLFILCTLIQLAFWLGIFSRLAFYKENYSSEAEKEEKKVSIIICARNEEENLRKNLPRILNQNYRSFEVIVVNHNSTDQTAKVLAEYQENFPYLRIIDSFNRKGLSRVGKKKVLAEGIRSARHDVLLLTDADCVPSSENWLRKMQGSLSGEKQIVLGYSPYRKKSGLLNLFIRYETIYTAIQYLSFALAKLPYMGVGRNLAYHKNLFVKANGFERHQHITSGDDDLFINEVATDKNVTINLERDTFILSEPKYTVRDFFRQKTRHLTTGKAYRGKHIVLLAMLSITHFGHYLGGLILISQYSTFDVVILFYLIRIISITVLHVFLLRKFQDSSMLIWIPFLDALYVLYYLIFAPFLFTGNRKQWT